jgi:hypothetical protein
VADKMSKRHAVGRAVGGVVCFAVSVLIFGFIVMWLWNALVPSLFHGPQLNYWQSVGILVLTKILFRGIGRGGSCGGSCGGPWKSKADWRARFEEKLATMSPEDRDKCRSKWSSYCGWDSNAKSENPKD